MLEQIVFWCCFSAVALLLAPYLDRSSRWVRSFVIWFSILAGLRYTCWRLTSTLPVFELSPVGVLAYAMAGMEAVCLYATYKTWKNLAGTTDWSARVDEHLGWYGATPPRVHVLIATYNEAWTVLERTLVA
jgi:cellulose synthase (UDP-forming)